MTETKYTEICTYEGSMVELSNLQPENISLRDIAHSLSQLCRFTGHSHFHYSVAQHSCLVASQAPRVLQKEALLHDAVEAYIGDISAPLKALIRKSTGDYDELDASIRKVIAARFQLEPEVPPEVYELDVQALITEKHSLFPQHKCNWPGFESIEPFKNRDGSIMPIYQMSPESAEHFFLAMAHNLGCY